MFDEDLSSFKISKKHHSEMPTIYIDDPSFSLYFILSRLGDRFLISSGDGRVVFFL